MKPLELFEQAELEKAIELQSSLVEHDPQNPQELSLLAEFLAFVGEWDLVEAYLQRLPPTPEYWAWLQSWREILSAERMRQQPQNKPQFWVPSIHLEARWKAMHTDSQEEVMDLIEQADSHSPFLIGFVDGRPFEGWRESDDFLADVLEFFYLGSYYWIPFAEIRKLRLEPAQTIRDTLFRPVSLQLRHQNEPLQGYLPLNYLGSHTSEDPALQIGQETDWLECHGFAKGVGTRVWLLGEEEICVNEISQIEIRQIEAAVVEGDHWDEEV